MCRCRVRYYLEWPESKIYLGQPLWRNPANANRDKDSFDLSLRETQNSEKEVDFFPPNSRVGHRFCLLKIRTVRKSGTEIADRGVAAAHPAFRTIAPVTSTRTSSYDRLP